MMFGEVNTNMNTTQPTYTGLIILYKINLCDSCGPSVVMFQKQVKNHLMYKSREVTFLMK